MNIFTRLKNLSGKSSESGKNSTSDQDIANEMPRQQHQQVDTVPIDSPSLETENSIDPLATLSQAEDELDPLATFSQAENELDPLATLSQAEDEQAVGDRDRSITPATGVQQTTPRTGLLKTKVLPAAVGAVAYVGKGMAKPFTGPRPIQKRPLFWLAIFTGLGAGALTYFWMVIDDSVSKYSMTAPLHFARPGTLTIKGIDGTNLLQLGSDTSETLKLWQFPEKLRQAFIAIEDRRFYEHDGVDYQGISRAIVSNIRSGRQAEGASTITQQVARMVYLDQDKNFLRKLKEARLAQKIEKKLGKDQIIERYLNLVYLGEGAYGVADAAWLYFGKNVNQLTLPQMATLAALPPAPNDYSPFVKPEFAKERRNLVLQRMQEADFITVDEMRKAQAAPLALKRTPHKQRFQQARYFTKYIEQELATGKYVKKKDLEAGGLIVETTLNPQWQKIAEEVVKSTVRNNSGSFNQAAMVSIDPRSNAIRTMVGGKEFSEKDQFNRVTQAKRQPGSTFKPILYTTAIAGGISPNKTYVDAPLSISGYQPKNSGASFRGPISMTGALTNSINIVAIKILIDTGFQPVIDLAHKMGIQSELQPYYSLALGSLEVNLLELANAYCTLASQGLHEKPQGISRIVDRQGNVLYDNKLKPQRILQANNTAIITSLMRNVVNEGTGRAAQLPRPVAGKTGTTDKAKDLWFMGFIPQLVTGVWLGNDNNTPTGNASSTAAYAWGRFMSQAVKDMPVQQFPVPDIKHQKAEIKLEPLKGVRIKTMAVSEGEKSGATDGESPRRRYRSRRSETTTEEQPRRRERASSEDSEQPRRRERASSEDGGREQPRRRERASSGDGGSGRERPSRRERRQTASEEG